MKIGVGSKAQLGEGGACSNTVKTNKHSLYLESFQRAGCCWSLMEALMPWEQSGQVGGKKCRPCRFWEKPNRNHTSWRMFHSLISFVKVCVLQEKLSRRKIATQIE